MMHNIRLSRMLYLVLFSELLGQSCAHDRSSVIAMSRKVSLPREEPFIIGLVYTLRDFLREEETSVDRLAIAVKLKIDSQRNCPDL